MNNKQLKELTDKLIELYARVSEMKATNEMLTQENVFLKKLILKK